MCDWILFLFCINAAQVDNEPLSSLQKFCWHSWSSFSEPQWSAGARSSSAPPPFNKLYKSITDRQTLEPATPCPLVLSPPAPGLALSLSHMVLEEERSPLLLPPSWPEWTPRCEEGRGGLLVDLCTTRLTLPGESLVMSQSVCLSSCIHRSVTYCRPPGGGHRPKGGSSGWDPLFWWMYSSHWTVAIYNLISKKQNQDIHWFNCLFYPNVPHTFVTFPLGSWNSSEHLMFRSMDGAPTLSRFCLFLLFFIINRVWTWTDPGGLL